MRILVFAPHAAFWGHAFPEALICEALAQAGHEIVYVGCGRQLRRLCVPMSAQGYSADTEEKLRLAVCAQCEGNDALIRNGFGLAGPHISELIEPADERLIDETISAVTRKSAPEVVLHDVPVGRLALYQLVIQNKRMTLDFSDVEWNEYLIQLRNTLYALCAGRHLIESNRPDRVVVYNSLYSVNRAVCLLAEKAGIPYYFLHAGGNLSCRLQTLFIGRGDAYSHAAHMLDRWPEFRDRPCRPGDLDLVTRHLLELFRAKSGFVYSRPKSRVHFDARTRFGLGDGQKLLLATMSSHDEEFAAQYVGAVVRRRASAFESQNAWIEALFNFARRRPDVFIVVRVHPREFPNRRETMLSDHARHLQATLRNLPSNAAVNWPSDEISLYDFIDQTDVVLNAWSSAGRELAHFGLPVVIYAPELQLFTTDLFYVGETESEYFAAIDCALVEGWSARRIRLAYRWSVFEFSRSTIALNDSFPALENNRVSFSRRLIAGLRRRISPDVERTRDIRRRRDKLGSAKLICRLIESGAQSAIDLPANSSGAEATVEDEAAALSRETAILAQTLFPTPEARSRSRLYRKLSEFKAAEIS
jgi:hypothetical protein